MQDSLKTPAYFSADPHVGSGGEFASWWTRRNDNFDSHAGPFWQRQEPDGSIRCAFRVVEKHLDSFQKVQCGCLMTFADYCMHAIASSVMQSPGITVNFVGAFVHAARKGELIAGTGEISHVDDSLIFVRGQLMANERTLFTFSGTIKREQLNTEFTAKR